MKNNKEIASNVLNAIGGKENISFATHCMTRLRINLKDESKFDEKTVTGIEGVIGCNKVGSQYQVIIGQNVDKVYLEFCKLADITANNAIDECLDEPVEKKKMSLKGIGSWLLDYLSVSMFSITPLLMVSGLCRAICVIFGSDMLGLIADDGDFYLLMDAIYNAGFYFLPIFIGYTAVKKLKIPEYLGLLVGAILISPSIIELADKSFTVYGISTTIYNYSETIMPSLLSMILVYFVFNFIDKKLPDSLRNFNSFLTLLVCLPFIFCLLAPSGNYLGNLICDAIMAFYNTFGIVALVLLCAFSVFLTMTGMHVALGTLSAMQVVSTAYDPFFFVSGVISNFTMMGMCFASWLKIKDKKEKSNVFGYFVSSCIGGVSEPGLYGIAMKYKKPFYGIIIGGAAGGLVAGLTSSAIRMIPPASNVLSVVAFFGDGSASVYYGILTVVVAFIVSALVTYFFGWKGIEIAENKEVNNDH